MKITVSEVTVKPGSLFSSGTGADEAGKLVKFVAKTEDATKMRQHLWFSNTPLEIDLEPWQYAKDRLG